MIRHTILAASCAALAALTASCGYFQAKEQCAKLEDIRVGMTKEEVT